MGERSKGAGHRGGDLSERDREDLARFRAALAKLTSTQKRDAIQRMTERPDTP